MRQVPRETGDRDTRNDGDRAAKPSASVRDGWRRAVGGHGAG
jgi:hypothetical protein